MYCDIHFERERVNKQKRWKWKVTYTLRAKERRQQEEKAKYQFPIEGIQQLDRKTFYAATDAMMARNHLVLKSRRLSLRQQCVTCLLQHTTMNWQILWLIRRPSRAFHCPSVEWWDRCWLYAPSMNRSSRRQLTSWTLDCIWCAVGCCRRTQTALPSTVGCSTVKSKGDFGDAYTAVDDARFDANIYVGGVSSPEAST